TTGLPEVDVLPCRLPERCLMRITAQVPPRSLSSTRDGGARIPRTAVILRISTRCSMTAIRNWEDWGRPLARHGPGDRTVSWLNAVSILAWTAAALTVLPTHGSFLYDNAYFYEQAIRAPASLTTLAFGPPVSGTHPPTLMPGG